MVARLALALCLSPGMANAGPGADFLTACSTSTAPETVLSSLEGLGWQRRDSLDAGARAILAEGFVLMNADRAFSPESAAAELERQLRQLDQLIAGLDTDALPGSLVSLSGAAPSVAMVVGEPLGISGELRCYYAGPAETRFSELIDQMGQYKQLRDNLALLERAAVETTTTLTRTSSVVSRFKPEGEALGLGTDAALSIYVLTRTTQKG